MLVSFLEMEKAGRVTGGVVEMSSKHMCFKHITFKVLYVCSVRGISVDWWLWVLPVGEWREANSC